MNPLSSTTGGGAAPGETLPKKIRAFVALKTPPEWDARIADLQQALKRRLRSDAFRWTKAEQIHITLRFLGSIPPEDAEKVSGRLKAVTEAHSRFQLTCEGLGCFPNTRRARVLWAGLGGNLPALQTLQSAIKDATHEIGEAPEDRPFKPHLTLARIEKPHRSALEQLEGILVHGFQIETRWNVDEVLLLRSHLSPQGARYEAIARNELG